MSWREVSLACNAPQVDFVSELLSSHGAQAVTLADAHDQPLFELPPGNVPTWNPTRVTGLFAPAAELTELVARLDALATHENLGRCEIRSLPDRQWERVTPLQFGRRLWVLAKHHESPGGDAIEIRLDPGLAFGTGHHATTALCLDWLESQALGGGDLVVDYGCGSGILAIAAAKLGAGRVIATDTDPLALDAARTNAERNAVAGTLRVCPPGALHEELELSAGVGASVVVANILAGPLIDLAPVLATVMAPGGRLALCGILIEQRAAIAKAYHEWFNVQATVQRQSWARMEAIRRTD